LIVIVHAVSNIQNVKACCDEVIRHRTICREASNRFSHKEF
jgi:hypothetical protein